MRFVTSLNRLLEETSILLKETIERLDGSADRILDLGFETSLSAIVQALPKQRQTLLFSATQTKSIKALARLSLRDP